MEATLSKKILKKVNEKTKDDPRQMEFIVSILREESKGLGWYNKVYLAELEKQMEEEQ